MQKIDTAILGATGTVGQRLISLLENHPGFRIARLCASERSSGKAYRDAANWVLSEPMPASVAGMKVENSNAIKGVPLVFSALDADVAEKLEEDWAGAGSLVVSNTKCHRMRDDVPLVIPEVNSDHLELCKKQKGPGFIVTNPNCSTIGLVMSLKPLMDSFGIKAVITTTLQAASGAGYPGVAALDLIDNIVPYIGGEEDKLETEPAKILARLDAPGLSLKLADFPVSASCNRVPVSDGHVATVSVSLAKDVSEKDIISAWESFSGGDLMRGLPSYVEKPIRYIDLPNRPQPRMDRNTGKGMVLSIGRLRPCPILGWKFSILSHNTIRGAAGGTILLAELCQARGLVK